MRARSRTFLVDAHILGSAVAGSEDESRQRLLRRVRVTPRAALSECALPQRAQRTQAGWPRTRARPRSTDGQRCLAGGLQVALRGPSPFRCPPSTSRGRPVQPSASKPDAPHSQRSRAQRTECRSASSEDLPWQPAALSGACVQWSNARAPNLRAPRLRQAGGWVRTMRQTR